MAYFPTPDPSPRFRLYARQGARGFRRASHYVIIRGIERQAILLDADEGNHRIELCCYDGAKFECLKALAY